jgi:hypothetical protein
VNEIALGADQHVLIGYGSLLSIASMERTLGHAYTNSMHLVHVNGWRRGWDVQMPNRNWAYRDGDRTVVPARVVYLNVRPDAAASINAAAFVVSSEELAAFDTRESVYDRIDVQSAIPEFRITGGAAWMYIARPEFHWPIPSAPPEAIIRRSYLDILDTAHAELGDAFQREYEGTTDAVPMQLVVDDFLL